MAWARKFLHYLKCSATDAARLFGVHPTTVSRLLQQHLRSASLTVLSVPLLHKPLFEAGEWRKGLCVASLRSCRRQPAPWFHLVPIARSFSFRLPHCQTTTCFIAASLVGGTRGNASTT
jgi:hypothetical protein